MAVTHRKTPERYRLPNTRTGVIHKFDVAGTEGYLITGEYPDNGLGEIFIVIAKEGSTLSGTMDAFATMVSIALQYGVPLEALVDKFSFMRFEPSGFTPNPDINMAHSIVDYIFRWLGLRYLKGKEIVVADEPVQKRVGWRAISDV